MPFTFVKKEIPDVKVVELKRFSDDRGFYEETFKRSDFAKYGLDVNFCQDNHSFSKEGVVRGLDFQTTPHEQGKLVYTVYGKIFDVAVDLRPTSRTFGKYVYEILSDENHKMLWIPPGFAHGFMALADSHVIYKTTKEYSPETERGILWNDKDLNIEWPRASAIVSKKDMELESFKKYISKVGNVT